MAGALLSSPHYLWSPTSQPSLRPRSRGPLGTGAVRVLPPRRRARVLASCSREPAAMNRGLEVERRRLLMSGLVSSFTIVLPISGAYAVMETNEDVKMNTQVDEINAYSFLYPVELPGKKFSFKWVESRKPERYSSAAPLSPDARQRIVSERVDMIHNVVISVSKVTTGQRMTESSVLDAHATEVDGEPYWYYEYLVRKSPTKSASEPNLFRHNVTCTAERDGYLYSLNASTLSKQWESMGPFLQQTVASFRLLPPTENYVPPYKDPWRFW
ncbi:psbP domain-containing protein 5, chloroplastic isoform X2 [Zea mays]|uniref:psbP domain-containing protein 5, chloroplastic isoform X2 n=1 Tax=Zea mays TaxID=4577 RepID=UPI0004DEC4D0|nr:psbP domain-containing protein 5, chloroplastic isoform X2 [Zea mays]|eukprot:XP_008675361.1 psbP domain-containing protein 5, chloroplastic isoform X2 [Zea mays]